MQLLDGLHKELEADFFAVTTRPAAAYRGNPFQVEVAIAYGRPGGAGVEVDASGRLRKKEAQETRAAENLIAQKDEPVRLLRFANRVPLLYQQASCAITKAVTQTNWRGYGLYQPKGSLPVAPMAILVHVASVWVPYLSLPERVTDIVAQPLENGRPAAPGRGAGQRNPPVGTRRFQPKVSSTASPKFLKIEDSGTPRDRDPIGSTRLG
jgi:hypothetical protein